MRHFYITILAFFLSLTYLGSGHAVAANLAKVNTGLMSSEPALIEAERMDYDADESIATASGNVEITQGKRVLTADTLVYNKAKNTVTAKGNISLLEPSGNVIFAETVELRDDLKSGVINNFSARFTDKSIMAARRGERINENKAVLNNAVYSPCPVCKDSPGKAPLWQVAANKATIDNEKQRVTYNNAFFEVYGVPMLYTPYFSHPTPGADRKSGFLTPKYSHDRVFGTIVKAPYYYSISPDKDATITPIVTAKEGGILSGEYRHLLENGKYTFRGSITNPDRVDEAGLKIPGKDVRSHLEGKGDFSINPEWGWGFDGKRASDDTYLKKYSFGEEDVLTSNLYANRIENRDHLLINTISFQGLKATDDPGKTPLILPYVESHTERRVGTRGARAYLDANAMDLSRSEGVSSRRISLKGGLSQPYISNSGNVFEAGVSLRGDGYAVDNVPEPGNPSLHHNGTEVRSVPEAELKWSMPLIKESSGRQYIIEPVTKFVISPNGGNQVEIPNEDSQDVEFSAENLFDSNHFSGYDRIETGARAVYGIRASASDSQKGDINLLFGQSYRAKEDNNFTPQSGLSDNLSDYVGKVSYNKDGMFDVAYKFRFDKDSMSVRNNTVSGMVNYKPVHFTLDYVSIEENASASSIANGTTTTTTSGENREIVIAGTKIDLTDKWQFFGNGNRNLASGQWISTKSGFVYKGDCVDLSLDWSKEFTRDRDIQPSATIGFQVSLKNMGQRPYQDNK